jgi:hypothetical protein
VDNTEHRSTVERCLDVFHIARRFIFVARLVAADRAHLIVVIVVFVGIFSCVSVGVLFYVFWLNLVRVFASFDFCCAYL